MKNWSKKIIIAVFSGDTEKSLILFLKLGLSIGHIHVTVAKVNAYVIHLIGFKET